ncbi:MAG: hypothetical protein Q9220_003068 [cf. Caloplaca sp. 1 TL-2023]
MLLKSILATVGCGLLANSQRVPPTLDIITNNADSIIAGDIYLSPVGISQPGPFVFDPSGTILYNGAGKFSTSAAPTIQGFRPCTYQKALHYCLWRGTVANGYGQGTPLILDRSFQIQETLQAADYHEFQLSQSLSPDTGVVTDISLTIVYTLARRDLSDFGVSNDGNQGWVIDCQMLARNVATKQILTLWSSLDHVPLNETYVYPTGAINGLTGQFAWDYFHMDSVARLASGDYIISSRHTSTIYHVSGKDGSILARLGGKSSTYSLQGFKFSSQHDVRVLSQLGDLITLSFFDNAYNTFTPPQGDSSGKIIELNTALKTARLVHQYNSPLAGTSSGDGGSLQLLPKGNVLIGWGSTPLVTEHTADGKVVYAATFGGIGSSASSYRAFKAPFSST